MPLDRDASDDERETNLAPPPAKRPALDASFFDDPAAASAATVAPGDETESGMDERAVRRLVLAFERAYAENVKQRVKHADDPRKFAESEIELDAEVKALGQLASAPEMYAELVRLNAMESVVAVLGHENEDVVADALEVVRELTDADAVESDEAGGKALAEAIKSAGGYAALYAALVRFEDASGRVHATTSEATNAVSSVLGIVENLGEIVGTTVDETSGESRNQALEELCEETDLLGWLLKRVEKKRAVDENKLYASEILAIILQSSAKCRRQCLAMDGLEALLQAVSAYKKREPEDDGERELVENLFDSVCAMVMTPETKAQFVELEGVELMLMLLRGSSQDKKSTSFAAVPALKCLDYVLSGNKRACERFVDIGGLKNLFPAFMGRNAKSIRKTFGNDAALEQQTRSSSLLCSLFKHLEDTDRRDRLCAKFVEDDFAKCDRLIELWVEFAKRVSAEQSRLENEDDDIGIELTEEEEYLQKLDAGLGTLEHLTLAFANLWATAHAPILRRLYLGASQNSITLSDLRDIIRQHAHHIGDSGGAAAREAAVAKALSLLPYAPGEVHTAS